MRCPFCMNPDSQVKDSRPTEDGSAIRRRRQCPACAARFTTFERVQLRELQIVKKSGDKQPFDREKLASSISIACRKRPVSEDKIERLVSGIQRQLEASGKGEISAEDLGELVMEGLHALDEVAYVRFASVYREFREARDFEKLVTGMPGGEEEDPGPEPKDTLF
ncbi:transcriptional regulator NrdR [Pacificimonas flava]|uniref:Transcriptional repressor NrdR n=2 Tax=Pacificimonas TaxID=1960290 RepID=A0A219B7R5_9SPHN|nr:MULTISPECIES: transcriptional regulator NrdR [Pacificimonas]MBZ6378945.1 transcriptional repressor NrdR [Pacificimonas aurantium]OWV33808.1 transcriptional regulator NrdR [Pacificimonas flava]